MRRPRQFGSAIFGINGGLGLQCRDLSTVIVSTCGIPRTLSLEAVRQPVVALRIQWRRDTSFQHPPYQYHRWWWRLQRQNDHKGTPMSREQVCKSERIIKTHRTVLPGRPALLESYTTFTSAREDLSCKTAFGLRASPSHPLPAPLASAATDSAKPFRSTGNTCL